VTEQHIPDATFGTGWSTSPIGAHGEVWREKCKAEYDERVKVEERLDKALSERDQWEQKALDAEFERDRLREDVKHSLAEAEDRVKRVAAERDRLLDILRHVLVDRPGWRGEVHSAVYAHR
jgi:flagellar motility protein MotE (MotC chaperone)